ncbi:MAG: hypothetical protein ABR964_14350 [Tepidisphaeraceae bacterium]|jgi:hypothetical protein
MLRQSAIQLLVLAMGAGLLSGCVQDNSPAYGRAEKYQRTHLQFGDATLEGNTRVEPVTANRDQFGLLHVQINIRSTTNTQQYVDCFITFLRSGQVVEKLGPKTVTLKSNAFDTITFNSTQPADDYFVDLDYAK